MTPTGIEAASAEATPAPSAPIVQAQHLVRTFHSAGQAIPSVRDVSLQVRPGEFIAIFGPSGSGKSTLLHMLGGLDRPTSGRVVIDGTDLASLSETQLTQFRRTAVGFVFQYFNLLSTLSVRENVGLPFIIGGRTGAADLDRVDDMMELFGLRGRERRPVDSLSPGEQQRVAIARAFLMNPAVVIADEPTGTLDFPTGREILQLLWESCDNQGQTFLVVTHQPRVAAYADRVLFLVEGCLVDELSLGRREEHDAKPVIDRLQELGL